MTNNLKSTVSLLDNLRLKKKSVYSRKLTKHISQLKFSLKEKQRFKKLIHLSSNSKVNSKKSGIRVVYSIYFSFSTVNTFMYVTDALGNLKFQYSAGLASFKGKLKKNRWQVLNFFFKELQKLRVSILKNKPIALHFNNVGFYKYFIVKNLKKNLFIKIIKNYQTYSFNGCRKKKKLRK